MVFRYSLRLAHSSILTQKGWSKLLAQVPERYPVPLREAYRQDKIASVSPRIHDPLQPETLSLKWRSVVDHSTEQESQVKYFTHPLWSNSVPILGVLHSWWWTLVVREGQNSTAINGRRCFSKQPAHLWDSSVLNLTDDDQLRHKGWN